MKTKLLKIDDLHTHEGTQIRAHIDEDTVATYAEAMTDATNKFPPIVVFDDGKKLIVADGFHRVMAAARNQFLDIEADVRKGTRADALRFALSANAIHGLRRTNADKRRSVELALDEWPKLSDREVSKICAVSHPFVAEVRQVVTVTTCEPPKRIGGDGKTYPATRKISPGDGVPNAGKANSEIRKGKPREPVQAPEHARLNTANAAHRAAAPSESSPGAGGIDLLYEETIATLENIAETLRDIRDGLNDKPNWNDLSDRLKLAAISVTTIGKEAK